MNDTTYIQHQIDLLKQELEKKIATNNGFKNFISKKLAGETAHKNDEAEILYKRTAILEKEN